MNNPFQFLIDTLGADNILESFCFFLGRDNCDFLKNDNRIYKTRNVDIPKNFSGLIFNGAHWKAYDKGKILDSYVENIQQLKSNNFCQAYAAFLWASEGLYNKLHNIKMLQGDYTGNIQRMSLLILKYIEHMESFNVGRDWLINAIPDGIKGIEQVKITLFKINNSYNYANEFSNSY